jgi:hypothetical protein
MAAECIFCKGETELYVTGVPVCIACSEAQSKRKPPARGTSILNMLQRDLDIAKERASAATATFNAVTSEIPSGIPHPDGTQRIHNASREMSQARVGLMIAHNRLNEYLARGVVPEDLKQGSGS